MKKIPDLGFWKLWNISFGFFGVQIAYALQSANISRIFSTLGQTSRLKLLLDSSTIGRNHRTTYHRCFERPHLDTFRTTYSLPVCGALVAVCVMCLLPNAGSFGMSVSAAMIFGLVSLMFLDTSINMAMQPLK